VSGLKITSSYDNQPTYSDFYNEQMRLEARNDKNSSDDSNEFRESDLSLKSNTERELNAYESNAFNIHDSNLI
jgi:hypothetical protein